MKMNVSALGFFFAALLAACGGGDPYDAGAHKVKYVAEVSTFAGGSSVGSSVDGQGARASFLYATGVAPDTTGDLYVADGGQIRKVTSDGDVTTVAASDFDAFIGIAIDKSGNFFVSGFSGTIYKGTTANPSQLAVFSGPIFVDSSTGMSGSFSRPNGLALDGAGNLYVADVLNHVIRKITPTGIVTTFAGSGTPGTDDGTGNTASFYNPSGLAVDPKGNIYVADAYYGLIRKITPAGVVSTVAGTSTTGDPVDGKGDKARLLGPIGLTIDSTGDLFVVERENHTIRKVTPDGTVTTLAGNGSPDRKNGIGASARFNYPSAITIGKDGFFYIADASNNMIRLMKMIYI